MKPAFLVVDMQKAYFEGDSRKSMEAVMPYINETAKLFRERNLPVVWIQDVDEDDGVIPETGGFEILEELKVEPGETRIHKRYGNAFNKTDLASRLQNAGIDVVVISGYCAEHCVLSTYRGALNHDLVPVLLKNGVAGGDEENLSCVKKISDVISYTMVSKVLENFA